MNEHKFIIVNDEFFKQIEKIVEEKVKTTMPQVLYEALLEFQTSKLLMSKKEVREKLGISNYKLNQLIEAELLKVTPDGKKIYRQSFIDYVKRQNA